MNESRETVDLGHSPRVSIADVYLQLIENRFLRREIRIIHGVGTGGTDPP